MSRRPEAREPLCTPRKLMLDVDTGTDDAVAFMLAALHPDLERVGVTMVETYRAAGEDIALVPTGPLTNIAVALVDRARFAPRTV